MGQELHCPQMDLGLKNLGQDKVWYESTMGDITHDQRLPFHGLTLQSLNKIYYTLTSYITVVLD